MKDFVSIVLIVEIGALVSESIAVPALMPFSFFTGDVNTGGCSQFVLEVQMSLRDRLCELARLP